MRTSLLAPQTSFCAFSLKRASCHWWTPTTPSTQAVEGQYWATAICTSKKTCGSCSKPPQILGCRMRKKPASWKAAMFSSGSWRTSLAAEARARSSGPMAWARATSSSWVGM